MNNSSTALRNFLCRLIIIEPAWDVTTSLTFCSAKSVTTLYIDSLGKQINPAQQNFATWNNYLIALVTATELYAFHFRTSLCCQETAPQEDNDWLLSCERFYCRRIQDNNPTFSHPRKPLLLVYFERTQGAPVNFLS